MNRIGRNVHGNGGRYASRSIGANNPRGPSRWGAATSSSPPAVAPPPAGVGSVLTFLSPSPARSRLAVEFLDELFQLPRIIRHRAPPPPPPSSTATPRSASSGGGGGGARDPLDELHFGSSPSSPSWDSVACACPTSGTILHFLSISSRGSTGNEGSSVEDDDAPSSSSSSPLRLFAVHGSHSNAVGPTSRRDALVECRRRLAETFRRGQTFASRSTAASDLEARARGLLARFAGKVAGGRPDPSWIVATDPAALALDLTPFPSRASEDDPPVDGSADRPREGRSPADRGGKLREVVLPFFAGAASSPQAQLSASSLRRPLPGLYQCSAGPDYAEGPRMAKRRTCPTANPGLVFRPLPAAREDLRLSPPSLVFQCDSLAKVREVVEGDLGGTSQKIGWRGHGQLGSLIVSHPSLVGLDVRICEAATEEWELSSSFDESQDSLLAGSVVELQSTHVISEGRSDGIDATFARRDERNGKGDCWVEFRSNVARPSGFVKSLLKKSPGITVAKPPDLPYD
jgi:hypothetical protein